MTEELKLCPGCARLEQVETFCECDRSGAGYPCTCVPDFVVCHNCQISMKYKQWQQRPIEDALRAEVEELRAELDRMKDDGWISVEERLPDKWYSDLGDELIVFKPGFTDMEFPAKWDNDAQEFFTGGYGKPVTRWKGITHYHQMPAPPEASDE